MTLVSVARTRTVYPDTTELPGRALPCHMSDEVRVSGLTSFPAEVEASDGAASEFVVVAVVCVTALKLVEGDW